MESISKGREQESNAASDRLVENRRKDVQKTKNQQQSSAAAKQEKKIQKQLASENMERMNYLYQCAGLAAKLTRNQSKLPSTQSDTSVTSWDSGSSKQCAVFSENKSPEKLSSVSTSTGVLPSATAPSISSKVSILKTSSQSISTSTCSRLPTQCFTEAETQPSNSATYSPVQLKLLAPSSSGSPNTLSSKESTVLASSPPRTKALGEIQPLFHPEIASYLGSTCRAIGRKCQLRMSHVMKRELCPSCYTPLVPSVTASAKIIRVRKKRVLALTCHTCGGRRKRPCQDVKVLWTEQPESRWQPIC